MFRSISLAILLTIVVDSASAQWVQQITGTVWPLFGVDASNGLTATAVGDVSTILRTTDAGQSWVPQTGENGQVFAAVSFCDDSNGTIGGPNGLTIYTHNAGALWSTAQVGEIIWYSAAQQLSSQWGIVGGVDIDGRAIVTVTTNGWQSFNSHTFLPHHNGNDYTGAIYGIHFVTTGIGFAAIAVDNGEGAICRTTDGGATWETVYWNGSSLYAIDFPVSDASQNGYAVGANGTVVHTTDGGSTWQPQTTPTTQQLNGVSFPTLQDGWAVGAGGTVIHTANGGQLWDAQESTTTEDLYAVSFANADTGYAVGNNGYIIFTANGGGAVTNHPPGEFVRVLPQDSTLAGTDTTMIRLVWTSSLDPDGDPVTYLAHFWSDDWDCVLDSGWVTSDTSVIARICIPLVPADEIFHFHWRAWATDGQDTVEASNGEGMFLLDLNYGRAGDPPFIVHRSSLVAYPNPFNPTTTLALSLPVSSEVVLRIFDVTGRLAKEMRLGRLTSGSHDITFDGSDLPSGVYLATMETAHARLTQKLALMK